MPANRYAEGDAVGIPAYVSSPGQAWYRYAEGDAVGIAMPFGPTARLRRGGSRRRSYGPFLFFCCFVSFFHLATHTFTDNSHELDQLQLAN
jgi:hypothetical protein